MLIGIVGDLINLSLQRSEEVFKVMVTLFSQYYYFVISPIDLWLHRFYFDLSGYNKGRKNVL